MFSKQLKMLGLIYLLNQSSCKSDNYILITNIIHFQIHSTTKSLQNTSSNVNILLPVKQAPHDIDALAD